MLTLQKKMERVFQAEALRAEKALLRAYRRCMEVRDEAKRTGISLRPFTNNVKEINIKFR